MRIRRVDPLIVAGAILLVITLALAALGARSNSEDRGLTASVYDEGPGGAATFRRLLEALGTRTTTVEGDRFLPQLASARLLFMLRPSELVSPDDVAALRAYLDDGGTVVLAHDFEPLVEPVLETFDIHFAQGVTQTGTHLSGPIFAAVPAHELEAGYGRELRLGPAWDPIASDDRAPTAAIRTTGRGRLIVVGSAAPFITSDLAAADNAHFAVDLAALANGGTVAFDEYHHGAHPGPTMLAVVERTWPGRALLFAMVVVFLFVVLTGRRLGPPLPLDPRPPRSSLEYVRGFAGLVRRAGRQEIVRDRLRRELHAGLARDAGLDPATSFETVVGHIRAASPARADEALGLDARLRQRLREHELVRTVRRVASLLQREGL